MKKILFIVSSILPLFLSAQTQSITVLQQTNLNKLNSTTTILTYDLNDVNVEGSPYFTEKFGEGELWTTNNTHYSSELLYRFDCTENSVQIKYKDSGKEVLLFKNNVEHLDLIIDGKKVSFIKIPEIDYTDVHKLYQVLYIGSKYRVVRFISKKFKNYTVEAVGMGVDKNVKEYKSYNVYYIKIGDKKYESFQPTKKSLIKAIPTEEKKLERLFNSDKYKKGLTDIMIAQIIQDLDEPK